MPYAKLEITIPDSIWISQVSRSHPETRFRVLAATANTAIGVARLEVAAPDPAGVCEEIRSYDTVTDLTVFESEPGLSRIQVETTVPLLLTSLQDSGVPVEMPFEVRDGTMVLEVTVPQKTLSELGNTLEKFGIQFSIERIQQEVPSDSLLTERQQWLLDEAIEQGYYDSPRRTTLVELAADLEIAKSTCSEILHRAEERVLKEYQQADREIQPPIRVQSD
ncbi:MAG: helix-turn-helix domain-containing protein [Halodesulfurarchaeum sp.]